MMLLRGDLIPDDGAELCDADVFLQLSTRKRFRVKLEPGFGIAPDGWEPHGGDDAVDTGRGFLSFLRVRWEGYDEPDINVGPEAIWWTSVARDCR